MVNFGDWLQKQWNKWSLWHLLLLPLSLVFWFLSAMRRTLYYLHILRSIRLPVPVIVVGNISVGGTGKTPLVLWLVNYLKQQGLHPGIISRGYGGRVTKPLLVTLESDPVLAGDEPVLLAKRSGCPVWVGQNRVAVAQALLGAHPDCDVLVSDDGLQHYRLARDVEVAVVDGARRFGNGLLLPAGPLRESIRRLNGVDAVVVNRSSDNADGLLTKAGREYPMQLQGEVFYNLVRPEQRIEVQALQGKRLHAIAGIGNPGRFFDHLKRLGLVFSAHAFPDHYAYEAGDLCFSDADAILMTEKDAVKCARLNLENAWVLAVDADVAPVLGIKILEKIRKDNGSKIA